MSQATSNDIDLAKSRYHSAKAGKIKLNWTVIIAIAGMHLLALLAFWPAMFSWSAFTVFVIFYFLTGQIGITLTYHRLLTHRSFRTPKWFEYLLTLCATLAWQGGPVSWVGTHRLHHKHSDTENDPHSPNHGFNWAHTFWVMFEELDDMAPEDAAKDLTRDRGHYLINKYFYLPQFVMLPVMFLGGMLTYYAFPGTSWVGSSAAMTGLGWIIWGTAVRTVAVYHVTWFVNSATHTWGYRNYDTADNSTNLWWVGILSFGEGWHNNHHAHQRSAAHGLRWFEFDITYWTIVALGKVGLATDIFLPKPEQLPQNKHADQRVVRPDDVSVAAPVITDDGRVLLREKAEDQEAIDQIDKLNLAEAETAENTEGSHGSTVERLTTAAKEGATDMARKAAETAERARLAAEDLAAQSGVHRTNPHAGK